MERCSEWFPHRKERATTLAHKPLLGDFFPPRNTDFREAVIRDVRPRLACGETASEKTPLRQIRNKCERHQNTDAGKQPTLTPECRLANWNPKSLLLCEKF